MKNQSIACTFIALGNTKEKSTTSSDEISDEGFADPSSIDREGIARASSNVYLESDMIINEIPRSGEMREADFESHNHNGTRSRASERFSTEGPYPFGSSMADTLSEGPHDPRDSAFTCRDCSRSSATERPAGPHTNHTKNGFVCASCLDSFAFAHCCTRASTPP